MGMVLIKGAWLIKILHALHVRSHNRTTLYKILDPPLSSVFEWSLVEVHLAFFFVLFPLSPTNVVHIHF